MTGRICGSVFIWWCSAIATVATAQPDERAELTALRQQVQQLEAQLKEVSRKLEAKERALGGERAAGAEQARTPAVEPATVAITDEGYTLTSADTANAVRLRALLQLDSRVFVNDDAALLNDMFVLRRARLITEGTLARNFSYQFTTEFGGRNVAILDAALTIRLTDALQVKAGKYKTPIGLEVLQSDAATTFTERSILANFLPNRDLGVELLGDVAGRRLNYAIGVFNGVADGANSENADFDEERYLAGRLIVSPFRSHRDSPLRGLLFGVGAGWGEQNTPDGRAPGYRTDGQQTYFSFLPSVAAAGEVWRVSPQLDYRQGPFGLMAEYVISSSELRSRDERPVRRLDHKGWQVTAGYVLTGEQSTYGQVEPRTDLDPAAGTWGAVEVVGRYAQMNLDDGAFPEFASGAASATDIASFALGVNWYLSKAVVFKLNYYHTRFGLDRSAPFAAPAPILRHDEQAVVTRFQLAF